MSEVGSDIGYDETPIGDGTLGGYHLAGNPNPMGLPFFRDLQDFVFHQEDRASLVGSTQLLAGDSYSDNGVSGGNDDAPACLWSYAITNNDDSGPYLVS